MTKKVISFFFILTLLTGCGAKSQTGKSIPAFSFTDQNGHVFGTEQLEGKAWIASFIFTKCETVCSPMTSEMATLQKKLAEEGMDVEFVSFTVDPTVDTPEILKHYIAQYTDNESNWHLLTGYSQEEIENLAVSEFQTIVQKPKTSTQVIHGTNFYLIDPTGHVVKEYNYVNDEYRNEMIRDIQRIRK
ncbi:SCO family protein [Sporosarcina sp. Te-1]|uniref:SCO family protein n=1 Tax=Sporosarcina sp. Te-1 TaxID=2818390 RepID=UPI001FB0E506|nr:SCO family protein [Sporosarcina sp. Te-1]